MSYNGWSNYDTWAVALVINNEGGYVDIIRGWVEEYASEGMDKWEAKEELAEAIKDMVDSEYAEALNEISSPIINQMVYAMDMDDIDYEEIADGFLEYYPPARSYNAKPVKRKAAWR